MSNLDLINMEKHQEAMQYEPTQLLETFGKVAQKALYESFLGWQKHHQQNLKQLQSFLNPLKVHLVQNEEWTDAPKELWSEVETKTNEILEWIESISYLPENKVLENIGENWHKKFDNCVSQIPDEIRILIGESYWHIQPGDRFVTRLRKIYQPWKKWFQKQVRKLMDLVRRFRHLDPIKIQDNERIISLKHFSKNFIYFPLLNFLINEWQKYLQAICGQYFILHIKTGELCSKSLILEKFDKIFNHAEKSDIFDDLYDLAEVLKNIDETIVTLSGYEKQFQQRFDNTWDEITENFYQAWELAGTFLLKNEKYSPSRLEIKHVKINNRFEKNNELWKNHLKGLKEEWSKDLHIYILQMRTAMLLRQITQNIYFSFQNEIKPLFKDILSDVQKAAQKFKPNLNEKSIKNLILTEGKFLLKVLPREKLPLVLDKIHKTQIIEILNAYIKKIKKVSTHIPQQWNIFLNRDTENIPPRSKLKIIPVGDFINIDIFGELHDKHETFLVDIKQELERTLRTISEIEQIIEFNFDSASNLLNEDTEKSNPRTAQKIVSEGLDLTANLVNNLIEESDKIPNRISENLFEHLLKFEQQILELTDNAKVLTQKSHKEINVKLPQLTLNPFRILRARNVSKIKDIWDEYLGTNRVALTAEIIEVKLARFLKEYEKKISRLPYVYQRLFRFEALSDERFFSGREDEMKQLQKQYSDWVNGKYAPTAIIGECGSGRTTLLNFAERNIFSSHPITRIEIKGTLHNPQEMFELFKDSFKINRANNLEELSKAIREDNKKRVCIVENLQNLFIRTVDGFEALERFLLLVSQTHEHVFWVVSCIIYSWNYLDKLNDLSKHFQKTINLSRLLPEEVQSIIIKRHRVSGFNLEFRQDDQLKRNRKYKKLTNEQDQQEFLSNIFFGDLNELSTGNVSVAMLYWLSAIDKFSDDKTILDLNGKIDYSFLNRLPVEDLFTLSAIVQHETLSANDHALVFRQASEQSSLHLQRMYNQGIITSNGNGYRINALLYRPLVETLKAKKLIH